MSGPTLVTSADKPRTQPAVHVGFLALAGEEMAARIIAESVAVDIGQRSAGSAK